MESTEESFALDKRSENSDTIKLSEYMGIDDEKNSISYQICFFIQ